MRLWPNKCVGMCVCKRMRVCERMYVCKESFVFEKTREQQSRKREAKECRASCVQSVQSIHNFLIKSDFCFRNHINWYKTLFPTNAWRSGTSNVLKGLIRVCENPRDDNLFSAIVHQCDTYCHDELLQFKSLKCTLNPYLWDLWITIVLVNLVEICNMGIAS